MFRLNSLLLCTLMVLLCASPLNASSKMNQSTIEKQAWGTAPNGRNIELYTLKNSHGMEAQISTWGACVVSLKVPDSKGHLDDVVLGYDSVEPYFENPCFFGAVVGRYANRIAAGKFTLNGEPMEVSLNSESGGVPCHLHGGFEGIHLKVWSATESCGNSLLLSLFSPDGEEGYPGNMIMTVRYTLTENNELKIDYTAVSDKDTVINLTNHSYFNLKGEGKGDILNNSLQLFCDYTTPVDKGLIPTGEMASVVGTPFDFTEPHTIGERIHVANEQLEFGNGYDHNWVMGNDCGELKLIGILSEPESGRVMKVLTTEPAVQLYTGNFVDIASGKGGKAYGQYAALCLETQHYPDSPNHPEFPTTELKAGEQFTSTTVYAFSTK